MSAVWLAAFALLGTAVTGLVTYLIARRGTSGDVDNTDAATLWKESASIRTELRTEADKLRTKIDILTTEVRDRHDASVLLQARLMALEKRINGS